MNKFLKPLAFLGLGLTLIPPVLLFFGAMTCLDGVKNLMLVGMALWFATAIPWLALHRTDFDRSTQDQI